MDPLSQGLLGAAVSISCVRNKKILPVLASGAVGGMLADVDIFIRSDIDPLLALEFHRQFTHSLIFIPFGGLAGSLLLWFFMRKYLSFIMLYLATTLGYATHGLLDACTSYGTQLFWPFTSTRIAWNIVSVIDPLFTSILLLGLIFAYKKNKIICARLCLICSILYLLLGYAQKERALNFQNNIASQRGDIIIRSRVHPSFGNLLVWRSTYETPQEYVVDGLRLGVTELKLYKGQRVARLNVDQEWPYLSKHSVLALDIERFRWFSDDWLYLVPNTNRLISDIRYSILPQTIYPLWAIEINPLKPEKHSDFITMRSIRRDQWNTFWQMLKGED